MAHVIRYTAVGAAVRLVTGNKYLAYPEDQPGFVWPRPEAKSSASHSSSNSTLVDAERDQAKGTDAPATEKEGAPKEDVEAGQKPEAPAAPESESDPNLVTWYGDHDPQNPQTFSTARKTALTALLGLYTTTVYIASAIYTPGLPLLEEELVHGRTPYWSQLLGTLGLSLFVLGYSVAPLVLTPVTMKPSIGRQWVYIGTFVLFIGLLAGSAGAPNLTAFLIFRFLSGLAGSPAISTVGVSLADIWPPALVPRAIAIWGSSASLGPILGPLIGAAAIERFGTWRSPLYLLLCVASFTLLMMLTFMPETSASKILDDRRNRLVKLTGRQELTTETIKSGFEITIWGTIVEAIKISVDPTVLYINAQVALAYTILYSWFESFPVVYGDIYGFTPVQQGLAYLFIGVGVIITVACYVAWLVFKLEPKAANNGGFLAPEDFIPPGFIAVACMPLCLIPYGWTARESINWAVPGVFSMFFAPAIFLAFMSGLNYLSAGYWQHLIAIFALNAFARGVVAAFGPLYSNAALKAIGVGWYSTILGLVSLGMVPLPFLLRYRGKKMRARSKWAFTPDAGH